MKLAIIVYVQWVLSRSSRHGYVGEERGWSRDGKLRSLRWMMMPDKEGGSVTRNKSKTINNSIDHLYLSTSEFISARGYVKYEKQKQEQCK